MAGFSAFVLCLMMLVISAEATSPGVTNKTVLAAATLTWAAHGNLEGRLAAATAEAARLAQELGQ